MNDREQRREDLLKLTVGTAALAAILPLHVLRVSFGVYLIYVFGVFRLWNVDLPQKSWKDGLSQALIFLSGVSGLVVMFCSLDVPWWSILFCVMLLGQIAMLFVVGRLRAQVSQEDSAVFRVGRLALTGMNLIAVGAHLYMIVTGHTGNVQGSMALYDVAFWTAYLLDIPRVIAGLCVAVDTHRLCKEASCRR